MNKQFLVLNSPDGLIGRRVLVPIDKIAFIADQDGGGAAVVLISGQPLSVRETVDEVVKELNT